MMEHDEWKMDYYKDANVDEVFLMAFNRVVALIESDYELDNDAKGKSKFIMLIYREAVNRKIKIPYSLQLWVAQGFDKYLKNEEATLQAAFKVIKPPRGNRKKKGSLTRRNMILHILINDFKYPAMKAAELLSTVPVDIPVDIPEDIKHYIIEGKINSSTPESILDFYYRQKAPSEIEKMNAVTDWEAFGDYILK
ncbi:hypothetical protein ABGN35_004747 [Yersinia enterocolitica]